MADLFKLVGRILIEHDEADEVIDNTTQKAKDLGDALKGTGQSADSTGKKIGSSSKFGAGSIFFGAMLTKMADAAVNVGKVIGKKGFAYNADMEKYLASYTAMLGGNSEAAQQLISDIEKLAAVTPMETAGLIKNAGTLIGTQQVPLENIVDTLRMLGDVAKGDQNYLDGLVRAYSQVLSAGKLNAEDLNQMADREVPIWQMIADNMGIGQYELREKVAKTFIPADVLTQTLKQHTSEGGMFYRQMEIQAETFNGKMSTLQDNATISVGKLMESFFEVAKSDVLPRLVESLEKFSTWVTENQDKLTTMAEILGKFTTISFDAVLGAFQWMTENGSAVAVALGTIATAFAVGAIAAHPYAAAVVAIAGALAYLNSESGKQRGEYSHLFEGYSESDLQTLQNWVNAVNEAKRAEEAYVESMSDQDFERLEKAWANQDAAYEQAKAVDGLIDAYQRWRSTQGQNGNDLYLDVPLQVSDDSEADMQSKIDGMNLEGIVKMYADTSSLNTLYTIASGGGINGSHANGLDYVPHDGYIARLHQGESVLTKQDASVWRSGTGGLDVDALASRFASSVMAALSGKPVVLESGAVVGQLLPAIDTGLGTASTRKGRRN